MNTSSIPCVQIFSQNGQLLISWPKFGEIAQIRAIFWSKYCWGCCKELGGDWNELGGGGWSWVEVEMTWVEVDWAGWRWVHGLVIPIIKFKTRRIFMEKSNPVRRQFPCYIINQFVIFNPWKVPWKWFSGWGTDRNIIKIFCDSRLFFVLHLLLNSVIIMAITRKAVEHVFILIQFSLTWESKGDYSPLVR